MLKKVSEQELYELINREHPAWLEKAKREKAKDYVNNLDESLDDPIRQYIDTNTVLNIRHGEFSLVMILKMAEGRLFLTAVEMMDRYIKAPVQGKAMILRR